MDPLNPLVPIEPPAPAAPRYNRVERIERDQQREPQPNWEEAQQDNRGDDQQFEDEYEPDWGEPASGYGPDGHVHDAGSADIPDSARNWDPRLQGERRSARRKPGERDDDVGGPHIDITA